MAIEIKKPTPIAAPNSADVLSKIRAGSQKPRPSVRNPVEDRAAGIKIMMYGMPGVGKTKALKGFMDSGLKVFCLETDLGGSGLVTIANEYAREGRLDYYEQHCRPLLLTDYEHVEEFLEKPELFDPGIYEWNPDMISWEGFSFFQTVMLDEHILSIDALGKEGSVPQLREEGLFAVQPDWNAIRRDTMRKAHKFFAMRDNTRNKNWHKYITLQEGDPEKDEKGNVKQTYKKQPLLYTNAKTLIAGGCDLVCNAVALPSADGKGTKFVYRTQASEKLSAKNRGFDILPEEPADMEKLWQKLTKA
jgi:hypothetical protein